MLYTETNAGNKCAYIVKGGEILAERDITTIFNEIYNATNYFWAITFSKSTGHFIFFSY